MKYAYVLRINVKHPSVIKKITDILHQPSDSKEAWWELSLEENEADKRVDYIGHFLRILEGKYKSLEEIGVAQNDISIWVYYEYDNQCNLEFKPSSLKVIGEKGITLCISCWRKGDMFVIE